MYSRLRFLTSASLIAFGTVVVAGATGVLPGLIERLSTGRGEVSRSCQGEIRLPWGRTCSSQGFSQGDGPAVAARVPGNDVTVVDDPDREQAAAIVEQPRAMPNTASAPTELMEPHPAVAPVQQLASAPPATEEAPQFAPTAQAPPAVPSVKPKPRPVKKVARREPSSERERDEAVRTVRRFGRNNNKVREIPLEAYAAERSVHEIIIRPTSIQDVYYYYRRR